MANNTITRKEFTKAAMLVAARRQELKDAGVDNTGRLAAYLEKSFGREFTLDQAKDVADAADFDLRRRPRGPSGARDRLREVCKCLVTMFETDHLTPAQEECLQKFQEIANGQ